MEDTFRMCVKSKIVNNHLLQCIEKMGRGCFTEEQMQELVKILNTILTKHDERQTTRQGKYHNCSKLGANVYLLHFS